MLRVLLTALSVLGSILPACARDLSVDFTQLPDGTEIYYKSSFEGQLVDVVVSQSNNTFVLETRRGSPYGEVVRRQHFNAQGLEVKRERTGRSTITFEPFNCERVLGECAHTIRVGSGDARAVVTRVWEDNGGYQFEARVAGVSDVRLR